MNMTDLPETRQIELERSEDWLTIWLNRPDSRNALSDEMLEELCATLNAVCDDRSVRGITLRGRGKVFCAGGDLKGFKAMFQGESPDQEKVVAANRRAGELFDLINTMPQVVVMLVHGAAIAGGLGMLCAGDVVVVTRDAKFALTETMLGIPPAQIAPLVVRRIGLPAARKIMLTAARFDGAEAKALGLANDIVEDAEGLDTAEAGIRQQVKLCAPGANAATKAILLAADRLERKAMQDFASDKFAECMLSDEGREGIAAFIEKRKPSWSE
jgi:isohexenylglutaconyl-CoA hydratase